MNQRRRLVFSLPVTVICFILSSAANTSLAQWSHDSTANTPISAVAGAQSDPRIASDGAGGAIITWTDLRSGNSAIYAQRTNSVGAVQWTTDGVVICTGANHPFSAMIVSDGAGGAIITWIDSRNGNYDIYAQRVNSSGVVQWTADGITICTAANTQYAPTILSDGAGGAIITWYDARSGNYDIYAQRVNSSGVVQWTANGVAISTVSNDQVLPTIVTDGAGGAIITWYDARNGIDYDIYAQRINGAGAVQWAPNGVAICTAANHQYSPTIASDGAGGAIITWYDNRSGTNFDIYAQRINGAGVVQWTASGVAICTAANDQINPAIVIDGAGGAIITWDDNRSGTNNDVYAQRINGAGVVLWAPNGFVVCTAAGQQYAPTNVSDGAGGAIITWYDLRSGTTYDVYAQKISGSGAVRWRPDGVAISTAAADQSNPMLVSDGAGGAIITWHDTRSGTSYDIYAQKVDQLGYLGKNEPALNAVRDVPGDQGGKVSLGWTRSSYDQFPYQVVTYYSIWRGVDLASLSPSAKRVGTGEMTPDFSGKAYRVVETPAGSTYWEWVGNVTSHYLQNYSFTAPTLADSGSGGTNREKFFVSAQTAGLFVFWDSNIDSAYSIDNLPPGAVPSIAAELQIGPSVKVHWGKDVADPDVAYYEIHRSASSGFTPGPLTFLAQAADTMQVDGAPLTGTINYYKVVTVDIHGNKSIPSPQVSAAVEGTAQYSVRDKWNMVSVALSLSNYSKSALYPTAISNAFAYQGSYVNAPTLANGHGYWLKFAGDQNVAMTGFVRTVDSIDIVPGWNMIGSISTTVAVTGIVSVPEGITTSSFFGYAGSYATTSTIEPGKAYWVKANQTGKLILSSSTGNVAESARIQIIPTEDAPPPSPEASEEEGAVPTAFALGQNYPNPFNPMTVIRYSLPAGRDNNLSYPVSLRVYDMLGQVVATLVDETKTPGEYTAQWDASNVPSGLYFYRLLAGGFSDAKRMMLLK